MNNPFLMQTNKPSQGLLGNSQIGIQSKINKINPDNKPSIPSNTNSTFSNPFLAQKSTLDNNRSTSSNPFFTSNFNVNKINPDLNIKPNSTINSNVTNNQFSLQNNNSNGINLPISNNINNGSNTNIANPIIANNKVANLNSIVPLNNNNDNIIRINNTYSNFNSNNNISNNNNNNPISSGSSMINNQNNAFNALNNNNNNFLRNNENKTHEQKQEMSYVNPLNISDDHPLSFKYIQKLHSNFKNLDQNDICFPYFYRIPEIFTVTGTDKKRNNCHSITLLKNYSFQSFEELRYLNYAKKNSKPILKDPRFINSIKNAKHQSAQISLSTNSIRINFFDLLTEDEKKEVSEYLRLYNSGIDKTADCFANGFNHVNYYLQLYAETENQKLISKGYTSNAFSVNNVIGFPNSNNNIGSNGNNNLVGFNNNASANHNNNNNNFMGNTIGNASNLNANLNNNVIVNNSFVPQNNFQASMLNNNNNLIPNNNFNLANRTNFGFGNNLNNTNPINPNQNNPFSNIITYQFNSPNSFQNQNQINGFQNPINNNNNLNNVNNPLLPTFSSNPSTNTSAFLTNNNQLNNTTNNNNLNINNNSNIQAGFNLNNNNIVKNTNSTFNAIKPNIGFNINDSNNNIASNNINNQNTFSNNILNNSDPKSNNNSSTSELKLGIYSEKLNYNLETGKENLFAKLIDTITINDNSNKLIYNTKRNFFDKNQMRGVSDIKINFREFEELENKNDIKYNFHLAEEKQVRFDEYQKKKCIAKELKGKTEINKIKKELKNPKDKINKENSYNQSENYISKNFKLHADFSKTENKINSIKNNERQQTVISEENNDIHRKIQLEKNCKDEKLLLEKENELKADLLVNSYNDKELSYRPNNYVKINYKKDFLFIQSNMIDEVNGILEFTRFFNPDHENVNEFNKLVKITIPKNNENEEFIVYFLTKENLDLENLKKVFIHQMRKSIIYSHIPEESFMSYLELIHLGKSKRAIPQREACKILLDDIENVITLRDSKIGFKDFKFIELYFLIFFSDLKTEYKKISSLQKNCEKLRFDKRNYPILRENLNSFILNPPYEEILSMPLESIKNLNLTIENKFGKIVFLEPLDLEEVILDSIRLDYFYFEILNLNSTSYFKLNKVCKVFLYMDEIKTDQDYIVCLKKLKEHYKKLQANICSVEFSNKILSFIYNPINDNFA